MNTESPTKRERTPEQKAKAAAKERERRAAAKAAAAGITVTPITDVGEPAPRPAVATDADWQTVEVDGKSVKVDGKLSEKDALAAARRLVGSKAATAEPQRATTGADGEVTLTNRPASKAAAKLPAGNVKFALSTSAYGVLVAADLDPRITKALKASDKIRSATKAANPPYHFPVMTTDDALACASVLAATAKKWEKPGADRSGNLASVKRYAVALREIAKA